MKKHTKSLKATLAEAKEREKGQDGVDKRYTLMKGAGKGTAKDASEDYDSSLQRPTDAQVAIINGFTRSPKSADELVVFDTWSMNDAPDRDYDFFPTQTVKDFAALPQPLSPVGKSYMIGHDYDTMPIGRIFAVDTAKADGMEWLKNSVYIPDIPANETFLANQDFGVYWAVSVGVLLDSFTCSICDGWVYSFFGMCEEGHIKGDWYDPKNEETDDWGYIIPCDPSVKGAVQCLGKMEGARDFYELSQVFLGAQYFASLADKDPQFAGVVKAAGRKPLGLSRKEADTLPLPHLPPMVMAAKKKFDMTRNPDGTEQWVDDLGLVRVYDPGTQEVLSLGKAVSPEEEEDDGEEREEGDQSPEVGGSPVGEPLGEPEELGSGDLRADPGDVGGGSAAAAEASAEDRQPEGSQGSLTEDEEEDEQVNEKAFLAAAKHAGIPQGLLDKAAEEKGDDTLAGAVLLLFRTRTADLEKEVSRLTPQAQMGESYIKDLTAQAIDAYVKAHTKGDGPVSTATFERILAACNGDADLLKSIRDEQMDLARAKFPEQARRSSFPDDPNERQQIVVPPSPGEGSDKTVTRLHG